MSHKLKQNMVKPSKSNLELLWKTFDYCHKTGIISYKVQRGTKKAGDIAGTINNRGYKRLKCGNRAYAYHHVCWFLYYGKWPEYNIDHKNRDRLDNQIANLRYATLSQQQSNSVGWGKGKYKGVCYHKYHKKWMAYINKDGKRYNLGYYDSEESAALVVDKKAQELYAEYAFRNLTFDVDTYTMTPDLEPQEPHVKAVSNGDIF